MKDLLGISVNPRNWELLPEYAKAGFRMTEISLPGEPIGSLRVFAREAAACARDSGVDLWSVHLPFGAKLDISAPEEGKRRAALDELAGSVDLARELGAKVLVVHGSSEPNEEDSRPARMEACARSLDELQAAAGDMQLALENLPRTCIGRVGRETVLLAEHCAGICFDVNHLLMEDHAAFLDAAEKRIITTHLSDYDGVDERHWLPGMGVVPWRMVRDRLLAAGYEGPFLFELGVDADDRPYPPRQVAEAWSRVTAD